MLLLKRIMIIALVVCVLQACSSTSTVKEQNSTDADSGKITTTGYWIHDKAEEMVGLEMGPFARLKDGSLLNVQDNKIRISKDEGKTWMEYIIIADTTKYVITAAEQVIQTSQGIIILAFQNAKETVYEWQPEIMDAPGAKLPTYAIRSLDGGKTWQDFQKLHDEWTGANRDIIETRDGSVVFTSMMLRHNPGHNTVLTYAWPRK